MPPNVLLVMSDEHNARFLSGRDDGRGEPVETPTMDRLAAEGTNFEQTYCPMPKCAPSRQSMLTGLEQHHARAWDLYEPLKPGHTTLPAAFGEAGYETALVGKMHFQGNRQFNGFDHRPYGDMTGHGIQQPSHQPDPIRPEHLTTQARRQGIDFDTRIPGAGVTEIPESQLQENIVARETIAWLREHDHANPDQPWFACASFSRPHFPLTAPRRHVERYWPDGVTRPTPAGKGDTEDHPYVVAKDEHEETVDVDEEAMLRARAGYMACVDYLDEVLGEFLATLEAEGFLEDTIVVYLSDHGDMAGEHGLWWKSTYHEGAARVPMMVQTPEHRAGDDEAGDVSTPVNILDLYPTLCGLAGVDAPDGLDGADLSGAIRTGTEPDRGPVYSDNFAEPFGEAGFDYRMVRDGRYKYVGFRDAPELLFDVEADPEEQHNLAPDATGEDREALERLRAAVAETVDFEAIERQRREDIANREEYALSTPVGTGNAYLMPDGRLVDAGSVLYKPDVLASDPGAVFADWPGDGEE
jgi:choline-sulfatase